MTAIPEELRVPPEEFRGCNGKLLEWYRNVKEFEYENKIALKAAKDSHGLQKAKAAINTADELFKVEYDKARNSEGFKSAVQMASVIPDVTVSYLERSRKLKLIAFVGSNRYQCEENARPETQPRTLAPCRCC